MKVSEIEQKGKGRRTWTMGKKFKQGKWVMLILALAVWCVGCSDDNGSTTSSKLLSDFHPTPDSELQAKIDALKLLLPESTYNIITEKSRNNPDCWERNWDKLGLPDPKEANGLNGQWYYTYENLIQGMAEWKEFASKDLPENTRKLEIAAFLANIAQETGTHDPSDDFGGPGCAIQENYGGVWGTDLYSKECKEDQAHPCAEAGYFGRGPHQLSWDSNYTAFGKAMEVGYAYQEDPDQLTRDPRIGIAGSIWFWGHEVRTQWSPPETPFKPSAHDVIVGNWEPREKDKACGRTKADFGVIINIINGGIECCKCTWEGKDKKRAEECCHQGCIKCDWEKDGVCQLWSCCDSIDCISEDCRKPNDNATNRVNYFRAIAEAMGVTIPDGFDVDCRGQLNFSNCPSY
jgi:hypothetical protein